MTEGRKVKKATIINAGPRAKHNPLVIILKSVV